jgi:hypothetical protein
MKDFLYYITSTSWFKQLDNGKVIKLERFYLLMSFATYLGCIGVKYDHLNDLDYSPFYHTSIALFVLSAITRVVFSRLKPVSKEVQDKYWKTQLMRFKDPSYSHQMSLYPNAEERLLLLENRWEDEFYMSADEVIANSPFFMKIRIVILIMSAVFGLITGSLIDMIW